jgi:hypothetical protein
MTLVEYYRVWGGRPNDAMTLGDALVQIATSRSPDPGTWRADRGFGKPTVAVDINTKKRKIASYA